MSELRRRNVIKVAVAYGVVTWVLIQVAETTFPILKLPEWSVTLVTALLLIGFPLALIFAWAFELTPEGIKLERHVDRSQSITNLTGRKLDYVIIAVLALALGYFAVDKFVLDTSREAELARTTTEAVTEQVAKTTTVDKSIAVLPFADMSPDGDQEYFSDGISEELLNVLSKIPGLRVTARTSSFQFKGENRNITDIGEQLNVGHILEGSVRKSGNQLRITAQLIKADDGFHLWSSSYDRELDDIFAVQDEISAAIVGALEEHLGFQVSAAPRVAAAPSTAAYEAYLRGRYLMAQRTQTGIEGAVREFEKAIALDPDYALAHAELAIATRLRKSSGGMPTTKAISIATSHARRAMALDPGLAEAHAATGFLLLYQWQPEEALTHFEQAIRINPNYAIVYNWTAIALLIHLGRYGEGLAAMEKAAQLDPLSRPISSGYVAWLIAVNRLAEAEEELDKLASIHPATHATRRGRLTSLSGNWANAALANLDALGLEPDSIMIRGELALSFATIDLSKEALAIARPPQPFVREYTLLGKHEDAVGAAKAALAEDSISSHHGRNLGLAFAAAGDYVNARPILEEVWQRSGKRVTRNGLIRWPSAAALVAMRRDAGDEGGADELVAAMRADIRLQNEAGVTLTDVDDSVEYLEGLAAYLAGERETGLALIAKAVEYGFFIPPYEAYLQTLYNDPGFAPIRASQAARQVREREKFLTIVCNDNPYASVWQPAEGTCEQFAAASSN